MNNAADVSQCPDLNSPSIHSFHPPHFPTCALKVVKWDHKANENRLPAGSVFPSQQNAYEMSVLPVARTYWLSLQMPTDCQTQGDRLQVEV